MAVNCARQSLPRSVSQAKAFITGNSGLSSASPSLTPRAAKILGFTCTKPSSAARSCRYRLPFSSRLPVELGCVQSLMPLHTANASALLKSMLSLEGRNWGWLSEDS